MQIVTVYFLEIVISFGNLQQPTTPLVIPIIILLCLASLILITGIKITTMGRTQCRHQMEGFPQQMAYFLTMIFYVPQPFLPRLI